ncbi:RAD protein [Plasmodium cynomolgi strain B]|uniref:RAD protein n=1 Tax=Plasmodium cynomolgi (strain B) TaxID=1120755 RepID=K6UQR0_PLACD|nr:RAD protein [Plasmodium cynomolgi strain B]GAB65284.1 RAD protein [Plasmodium cynomolgi strain B]
MLLVHTAVVALYGENTGVGTSKKNISAPIFNLYPGHPDGKKGAIPVEEESWEEHHKVLHINEDPFFENSHLGRFLSEDRIDIKNNIGSPRDSFESYRLQVPFEMTREELKKRIAYCGRLFIQKKRVHAAIYVYINYLRGKYYNMINELKSSFLELASKNELPEDLQKMYWRQCEEELLRDLVIMENISEKYFQSLLNNKVIFTLQFNWTLGAHEAFWFSDMFEKELKWNKILSDRANNYLLR